VLVPTVQYSTNNFVVIFGGEKTVQSILKQVKQQSNPVMQIYVNLLRPLSVFKKICRTISAWWKTANSFHLFLVLVQKTWQLIALFAKCAKFAVSTACEISAHTAVLVKMRHIPSFSYIRMRSW
jgi:hypothetical protein